ncbi:MAG TPA: alanine racemase [Blastocatellia bacterium]|nr:alanine racemase [Blastocatellia bacterium]
MTGIDAVRTPALAIYADKVAANIAATLRVLGGDANRWRPHVKTSKLGFIMRRLIEGGVTSVKCATTLELQTVAEAGATDILLAFSAMGANARRVRELAEHYSDRRISALVEDAAQISAWTGGRVSLLIDINCGMDRTGLELNRTAEIVALAQAILNAGLTFRGLHVYDGQMGKYADLTAREQATHQNYDQLMELVAALSAAGIAVEEVITAGTPAFPCALTYQPFKAASFIHRVSPGTVVYGDCTSTGQLPAEWGYEPAAVVVATVVSRPTAGRVTCDAGHKAVSADAGVPTCSVLGRPELQPDKPSEEHLPINVPAGAAAPALGEHLYLVPRHVCPTVNNFDYALIVEAGRIVGIERVTARGREIPVDLSSIGRA